MADISQIKLPNGDIFDLVDESKSTATNWVNGSQDGSVRMVNSTAESSSYTIGIDAVAEGTSTKASGTYSHAEGGGTTASNSGAHAEGSGTTASGSFSHAEGGGTKATAAGAHAEGQATTASSDNAHSEGYLTEASGADTHSEGYHTIASGYASHTEGYETTASGVSSHAEGYYTVANHLAQHVLGQYNIADDSTATASSRGNYVEIVGNGSSNARSNARTLDWSGNEVLAGKLTLGTTGTESMDVATIGQLPTKTSDLTNDSGFITSDSDEKLKLEAVANGIYYPIVGKDAAASVRQYDTTGLSYQFSNGTTTSTGIAELILGNNIGQGTAGNKEGRIKLFGPSSGSVELYASTSTQNRLIKFPNQDGTVALISDIPSISYPVTSVNSKTGAVSLTASDVGALASSTTYVSTITTTAGAHTAISSKSGAVNFNVPTKTSHLTNDSGYVTSSGVTSITLKAGSGISLDTDDTAITTTGIRTISHADTSSQVSSSNSGRTYIQSITLDSYGHVTGISTATESVTNTDTKLQVAAVTSGTQYYPIVGTAGTSARTRQYDTTGFKYKGTNGTTSAVGSAILELGNSTASGTANNKQAQLIMYGSNAKKATITLAAPSEDVALALPTSGGTLALTSQIPTYSIMSASELSTGTATTARTMSAANTKAGLLDLFYPVGSYYETSNTDFDPNDAWGGTWVLETEGQVHISAGSTYSVAGALTNTSDGGEKTHTLDVSEMPSHTHALYYYHASGNKPFGYNYQNKGYQSDEATSSGGIVNTGGGGAHNNMQPYIIVYRWHRTA